MTQEEHNPTDLAGQERTTAKAAEEERLRREREANDLRWVLSTKQGRRFMWRLLSEAGVYRLSFNTNAATMAFNEGARNIGLGLVTSITEACPDLYAQMRAEQKDDKERHDHRIADSRNRRK